MQTLQHFHFLHEIYIRGLLENLFALKTHFGFGEVHLFSPILLEIQEEPMQTRSGPCSGLCWIQRGSCAEPGTWSLFHDHSLDWFMWSHKAPMDLRYAGWGYEWDGAEETELETFLSILIPTLCFKVVTMIHSDNLCSRLVVKVLCSQCDIANGNLIIAGYFRNVVL